jgi:CRP/FNR family transcriptional regulator, cyclic AMP receptor protein
MASKRKSRTRTSPFFQKLSPHSSSQRYEKGDEVFAQGDAADSIFRIERGNIKLSVESLHGKKAVISILRAGDCFGEACLFHAETRKCSAISIGDSTIGRIGKSTVLRILREEPAFATNFVSHLLQRLGRVEDDLADQLVSSSEMRLARLLMRLSNADESAGRTTPVTAIDQGTLAQMVGTTRSRISHFMNDFREKKMIDYNGDLHVHQALLEFLRSTES